MHVFWLYPEAPIVYRQVDGTGRRVEDAAALRSRKRHGRVNVLRTETLATLAVVAFLQDDRGIGWAAALVGLGGVGNTQAALEIAYLVVEMLLGKGADVNAQGGKYGTALYMASNGGHKEIVGMLLGMGADVNAQGGYYGTPLQAASNGGHKGIVEMLLGKGADVNAQGGDYGTALQAASHRGHKEVAASLRGHKEVVKILLGKGADVHAQGGVYGTALQAASHRGHKEVVEMLLHYHVE
ncbi:ankyrin repeat-containing domain protein [Coniochaeta sp. 2T2.1]|nr:ankyrin repeat-containing domain protein [Coniochaeta sp. 2T2.1]